MNQHPTAADWATTRGEKWGAQLSQTEAMLLPVDEPLIDALQLAAPCRIAEIGCGGGGTALAIARRAAPGSAVHGYDISPKLVEIARERIPADQPALAFQVADVATTAPEKPYDRLVSRFGIMFFDEPTAAFRNLLRWLAPGGRFAFAAWGRTSDNPWMTTVRDAVAQATTLPAPDPEAPGPFRYADADKLLALLAAAGFTQLAVNDWRGTLPVGGALPAAGAAQFALASFSALNEALAEAGDAARELALRSLTASFAQHEQGGAVHLDARVHIFTGIRDARP
jgi:SAM-dependent methyltransferase